MSDKLFPKSLAYRDILFKEKKPKWRWQRELTTMKTQFRHRYENEAIAKTFGVQYDLDPFWIRNAARFMYFFRPVALIGAFLLIVFLQESDEDLRYIPALIVLAIISFLRLPWYKFPVFMRMYTLVAADRIRTYFRRLWHFGTSLINTWVFKKNKSIQERVFRTSPAYFEILAYTPTDQAFRNLLAIEAGDVFLQAFQDGVHKDLSARALLQLETQNVEILKQLVEDPDHEFVGHAAHWLERIDAEQDQ